MLLFIDTTDFHNLRLAIVTTVNNTVSVREFATAVAFNENYKTNEFVEKFLKQQKVQPKDLKKIMVCSGPGSFTGIRVGVSLAQALGFALNIPVIVVPKNKVPEDLKKLPTIKTSGAKLNYGQKPNITVAKKKKAK